MFLLMALAVVWLVIRVAAVVQFVLLEAEPEGQQPGSRERASTSGAGGSPQDAPFAPQDAVPGSRSEPEPSTASAPGMTFEPPAVIAMALWREVNGAVRELADSRRRRSASARVAGGDAATDGKPSVEWLTALHASIFDSVVRPVGGPPCLGGREDTAYLRGWDDAVDWLGRGHDAQAPTWAGVAYMTGWKDAVREVDRARRGAAA